MNVRTADGWSLSVRRLPGEATTGRAALLLHAMMVDGRTMDRSGGIGTALSEAGIETWVADFRGHGGSGPTPIGGGRWNYDHLVEQDVPALCRSVRAESDATSLVVVGHSLGGHVTAASAGRGLCSPDGLVLLAANTWVPGLEPSRRMRLKKGGAMAALGLVSLPLGRFPSRRLGVGPADESGPYIRDLVRTWYEGAWTARDGFDYLEGLGTVTCPALAVLGRGDHLLAHHVGASAWARHLGGPLDLWRVGRPEGLPFDPGHMELVTDPRCRPIWDRIAGWVVRAGGSPPR